MIQLRRLLLAGVGCLAAALAQPALAGVNTLTRVGPYGGPVSKVAFHPTDSSIVYVTTRAGFYRSTDGGQSWQIVDDRIPNGGNDIAVHVSQPNRVFVVSAAPGVLGSTDAGATLSRMSLPTPISIASSDVEYSADGSTLYVSTGRQVYRSSDHGASWQPGGDIPVGPYLASSLVVDPTNPNQLYAVGDTGQAYQSSDSGVSWRSWSVPNVLIYDLAIANTQPTPRIWAATATGIRYSDDRGASWTFALVSAAAETVTIDPHDPTVVYVGTYNEGLLRTQDNGDHWSRIDGGTYVGIIRSIAVDPASSNRLIMAGDAGLARTDDGGAHWTSINTGIDAGSHYELVSAPASDRIYTLAPSDGIYSLSPEDGASAGLNNEQLRQLTGLYGFHGRALVVVPGAPDRLLFASDGSILRSLDGGASWSWQFVTVQEGFYQVVNASADGSRLLATTGTRIYVSTDGGDTWAEGPAISAVDLHVMASAPSNPQRVYLAGRLPGASRDIMFSSTDGGATWSTHAFPGTDVLTIAVDPSNDQTLYTAGGLAEVFKSTNGGESWTLLNIPGDYTRFGGAFWAFTIDPQNPNILYAGGFSFIVRSVDGGATWQQLFYDTERFFDIRALLVDPLRPHNLYIAMPGNGMREFSVQPDLRIAATDADIPAGFGVTTSYTYRLSNAGPFDATNVRARIQLPDGVTNIQVSSAAVPCTVAGTVVTCTTPIMRTDANAEVTISVTHPAAGNFSMAATIEGDQPDASAGDNSVTSNLTVAEVTDLSVLLTGSAIITRGDAANLTLRVTNAGPNTSSVASVRLELGAGMTIASVTPAGGGASTCVITGSTAACQLPQLAVGATVVLNVASTATTTSGSFTHMATVEASGMDIRGANNVAPAVTTVSDPPRRGGGGGGGSTSPFMLLALLALTGLRAFTSKFERSSRRPLL